MTPTKFQKQLDNKRLLLYNTSKSSAKVKPPLDIPIVSEYLANEVAAVEISEQIKTIGKAINNVVTKHFPSLRTPIIAGGAIRDACIGLRPKDYDVFFDLSSIDEDEREDTCLLLISYIYSELKVLDPTCTWKGDLRFCKLDNGEYGRDASVDAFCVYEPYSYDVRVPVQIQVIGHVDSRLSDDVKAFVNAFDYSLVKGYYDPSNESFVCLDEMKQSFNTGKITFTDEVTAARTNGRVESFIHRATRMRPTTFARQFKYVSKLDRFIGDSYGMKKLMEYYKNELVPHFFIQG